MPWGTEFPTRVRTHRTAWSAELAALPGPPHREVWTSPGAQANAPALTATAQLLTPAVKSGAVAHLPASGDSFPHQFPWQFGDPKATLRAKAELLTPSVGVGPVPVVVPLSSASAELLAPEVSVTTLDVVVEAPLLTASADMPQADLVAVVEAPLLEASARANTFPYQFPRSFAPNGLLLPELVAGADAPVSAASAELLAPGVSVGYAASAPMVTASASVPTPAVASGVAASAPMSTASASLLTPAVIWDQPPVVTPYTSAASIDVAALRAAGYTHVDLVGVGGGASGQTGSGAFGGAGNGGKAGVWNSITLDLSTITSLQVTAVGSGGAQPANSDNAGPNAGTATTFTWTGGSLTCAGGSGSASGQNGESPGNYALDGQPYTGGSGGTGNAGAPTAPGGAGAGGNGGFFGSRTRGAAGAAGRAWIRAKRIN